MPRIVRFRMSTNVNHRYDVQRNVGLNQPNMQLDVLLVQFFLNHVATLAGPGPLISIPQDGVCGTQTADAIRHFQQVWNIQIAARSAKPSVRVDGVVSPAQGATFGSFAQNPSMTWTSIALNAIVGNEPNFGPQMYCHLHAHPDCPDPLKPFFAAAPAYQPASPPTLSHTLTARLNPVQRARVARAASPGSERAAALGTPRPSSPVQPLRPGQSAVRTPARPYNRQDPGVLWAQGVLSEGAGLFTPFEMSDILESMEGTGGWTHEERKRLLLQLIYACTGEAYPADITIAELREFMRQEVLLGPTVRARGHPHHF